MTAPLSVLYRHGRWRLCCGSHGSSSCRDGLWCDFDVFLAGLSQGFQCTQHESVSIGGERKVILVVKKGISRPHSSLERVRLEEVESKIRL